MASKLWTYGKRLTLWGALLSSLPVLFISLMFFSFLGILFSVPLGCSVALCVCLRKFYSSLFKEKVEVQRRLGIKEGVSDAQEIESQEEKSQSQGRTVHEDNGKPLGEETEKLEGYEGESQAEWDPLAISSGEQPHEGLKYEGVTEKLVPHEEGPEEAQAQVREEWVPHEEAPEAEAQEKWDPDEEADTLQWAAQNEQLDPLEEQGPEVETHKHEAEEAQLDIHEEELQEEAQAEAQLVPHEEAPEEAQAQGRGECVPHEEAPEAEAKEKWDPDEEADTLQWTAQNEQLDPLEEQGPEVETHKHEAGEAQLGIHEEEELQGEREAESGEEGEAQLKKKWDPHGEGSPMERIAAKEQAPEDEAHYRVKDEEEASQGEAQLKWYPQEEGGIDSLAGPQEEGGIDSLAGLEGEEGIARLVGPQEDWGIDRLTGPQEEIASPDQAVEVETQASLKKEVEVKVYPSEGEAQSDDSHVSTGENIGTKHKIIKEQDENNEKPYSTATKHKITEEEHKEQDESNGVQDIPHKRCRHEQSLDLTPSTLYTDNTSTEANMETPEATHQSIQAESPLGASNLSVENDEPIEDNGATGLPIPPNSDMLVSSASESDKDSKSLSGGTVKEDIEDAEHIWEEIHALRNVIGYKENPHLLYAEEIKALYVFTGVEPPASFKHSGDLDKAKEKLMLLKLVYGIK